MVLGLAPAFILGIFLRAPAVAFHLTFWTDITAGILEVLGQVPAWMMIGEGGYAALLGVNVWGLGTSTALYLLAWAVARILAHPPAARPTTDAPAAEPAGSRGSAFAAAERDR